MYCVKCGAQIADDAQVCPNCGAVQRPGEATAAGRTSSENVTSYVDDNGEILMISEKNWLAALLLEIFLGVLGIHRFYVGKIGTGILWLITAGWLGIGWLVDLIMIACGSFKDKQGRPLKPESWKNHHRVVLETRGTEGAGAATGSTASAQSGTTADELLKWKKLLDDGIITQEEFDAKKEEILNR